MQKVITDDLDALLDILPAHIRQPLCKQKELSDLLSIEGLHMEEKGAALAIHFRNCTNRERARERILEKIKTSKAAAEFRLTEGKMVVELRPPLDVNKGAAVETLIKDYRLQGGIYLGDDSSDMDAFRVMHREFFLAIGVIGDETPVEILQEADYTLNGVSDVARFLQWLSEALQS